MKLAFGSLDIVLLVVYLVSTAYLSGTRIRLRQPVDLGDVVNSQSHSNRQLLKGIFPILVGLGLAGALVAGEEAGLARLAALVVGTALVLIPMALAARQYDPTPEPNQRVGPTREPADPLDYGDRIGTLEDSLAAGTGRHKARRPPRGARSTRQPDRS